MKKREDIYKKFFLGRKVSIMLYSIVSNTARHLPVPMHRKIWLKNLLFSTIPLLFRNSEAYKNWQNRQKQLTEIQATTNFCEIVDFKDSKKINDSLNRDIQTVLVDLLFCQPGYHGGGEYGKAVYKALAETCSKRGNFQLWVAIDPNLFIDPWVWEMCRSFSIGVIGVRSYEEIIHIVNSDQFDAFFTPAIVVYTGYEYMKKVGTCLPFTCKKTRVIGTLHDIRDYELASSKRKILEMRKKVGCTNELKMSEAEIDRATLAGLKHADSLRGMYRAIIQDETVNTIVTISSYCENSIKKNIGSPSKELKVLASPQKPRPIPVPFSSSTFDPASSPYALMLHAARDEKNGTSAVVAFDQLFEASAGSGPLSNLHVVLTGVTYLDQLGLVKINHPDRFVTLGEVSPGNLEYLIKHAQFLVYPSLNEGFGYPPIEAMKYGVPSIVSNVTAIPEVCGRAAVYCNPYCLESIKAAIIEILSTGINANTISDQYKLIESKQESDLLTLVNLISLNSEKSDIN